MTDGVHPCFRRWRSGHSTFRLIRLLLLPVALGSLQPSCLSGGNYGGSNTPVNTGEVDINTPTSASTYACSTPKLLISGSAFGDKSTVGVVWSNSATGLGGAAGTTMAVDFWGNERLVWSADVDLAIGSNVLTVTASDNSGDWATATLTVTNALGPPPTPTNLTAVAGNAQVTLSWSAAPWADSYTLHRHTLDGSSADVDFAGLTSTNYVDGAVVNGETYKYSVLSVDSAGSSASSLTVWATPADSGVAPPSAPTGLTASTSSNYWVDLTWSASSSALRYNVCLDGVPFASVLTTDYSLQEILGQPPFDTLSLPTWSVTAVNAGGESGLSNPVSPVPQP